MSDTSYVNVKDVFFTSLVATIQGFQHSAITPENAEINLQNVLDAWHFRRIPVAGDGNCLFTAIAMGLIDRLHNGDQSLIHLLQVDGNATITTIVKILRERMVAEWNSNDFYQAFVTVDISTISDDFLASEGDLGDLMVLTIANILHCPITVFTSINDMPIICITPTVETMDTTHPVFLTFIQSGSGHYDYALPYSEAKVQAKPRVKCNCGRKTNFKGKACLTSRCTCVRSHQPCTFLCRCKTCSNSAHNHRQLGGEWHMTRNTSHSVDAQVIHS